MSEQASTETAAERLREAAQLNRDDPNREGSLLTFGSAGQLVMTGDMHGNLRNFDKLQRYCDLEHSPGRSVILHELIHSEPETFKDPDYSIDLLVKAARWKCDFPDNVFFLQSNHELSQLCGHEIVKGGRSVLHDFVDGVRGRYPDHAEAVLAGVLDYIESLPLAARTAKGILLAHSLPDELHMQSFDETVFARVPSRVDLNPGGSAHALVWGRFQPPECIERFAQRLGVTAFIVGHTPQEEGYAVTERMIILASDHNHGVFLPIDLSKDHTIESLVACIRKFVSVV